MILTRKYARYLGDYELIRATGISYFYKTREQHLNSCLDKSLGINLETFKNISKGTINLDDPLIDSSILRKPLSLLDLKKFISTSEEESYVKLALSGGQSDLSVLLSLDLSDYLDLIENLYSYTINIIKY